MSVALSMMSWPTVTLVKVAAPVATLLCRLVLTVPIVPPVTDQPRAWTSTLSTVTFR